ncbi:hypothetical protein [Parvularcula sp. IMCC14364]|uniref:hypothetical protein n=1 Tax=Parvularcula sp. IMCC14364 TaxID=3067902 RepID=UPI002740ECD5|nr:hypothetical protein [Parvularcula sp. IMCC14364]
MAQAQEENHWPGFVDALSTIVMVVTFLLIILAIAIFIMSLSIAKVPVQVGEQTPPNMPFKLEIEVADKPISDEADPQLSTVRRTENALKLGFSSLTVEVDEQSKGMVAEYLAENSATLQDKSLSISSYYDPNITAYTKAKRLAYYRAMSIRNVLLDNGYEAPQINIHVKEAHEQDYVNSVIVHTD